MGEHQFIDQARLAHTGLSHEPYDMPMRFSDMPQQLGEEGEFPRTAYKLAQRSLAV